MIDWDSTVYSFDLNPNGGSYSHSKFAMNITKLETPGHRCCNTKVKFPEFAPNFYLRLFLPINSYNSINNKASIAIIDSSFLLYFFFVKKFTLICFS